MAIQKNYELLFSVFIVISLFVSCSTFHYREPYPNMEIVRYGNSQAYIFKNILSDKLIINIDGSGWDSVLGTKDGKKWATIKNGAQLLKVLGDKYTFFIPEKLKRQPGMSHYNDMEDRAIYSAGNLLDCYTESINGYLSEHTFSSIILIGSSEGGALLPLIYERMNNKDIVKALISISFGGLSLYESYNFFSTHPDMPPDYRFMYQYFVDTYKPGKSEYPDSFVEDVFGVTHRWFNSFKDIRPFDYFKNINIPVLFVHGDYDYLIPVDSTIYIQENLPEKPFEYKYFKWAHQPENHSQVISVMNEITEWIEKTDQ